MTENLSVFQLISEASLVVQFIMLILLGISIFSWVVIFQRFFFLRKAKRGLLKFEEDFWSGGNLHDLFRRIQLKHQFRSGIESIFLAGYKEFSRLKQSPSVDAEAILSGTQRAMRVSFSRESANLEANLPFLATAASASPYIGLFGTVWGIMNAFIALGQVQQATLSMVAPGIAEALIATAMGLFAAIPAVIGYNRYSNQVNRMLEHYDNFLEEFSNIIYRQAHSSSTEENAV